MRARENKKDPLAEAREEERERIAGELHDGVLQTLAAVALRLDAARKLVQRNDTATRNDLEIAAADVRSSIREIRSFLFGGDNKTWVGGTLLEKIKHEARSIEQRTGLEIGVQIDPPGMTLYHSDLEYGVFQATREALRNVVRHAQASKARLSIAFKGNTLQVSLSDNGRGFDQSAGGGLTDDRTNRYGLWSMKARIERLGGTMAIRSGAAQGTTVSFSVPAKLPTGHGRKNA